MKFIAIFILVTVQAALLLPSARAQTAAPPDAPSAVANGTSSKIVKSISPKAELTYKPPTNKTKFHNYLFDAFGPYPIAGAAIAAGINQASNKPPDWRQGAEGYGKRFASNFGIAAVSTTARYGLAQILKEDTLYYRCACKGFPRLTHALISTLTARRGEHGHTVFSFPALIAPYAGTMTAVYGWYPERYNAKDAFRMGNYTMLGYAGSNIALEYVWSGPHALLARLHLKNGHVSPQPEKPQQEK